MGNSSDPINELETAVDELEQLALLFAEPSEESWLSEGGIGDRVAGIQVVRNGQVIQEWHDERSP